MQEVADWLNGLGMSEYAPRFAENDIDMEVLGELTDADFDRLGVSLGHRRKLLKALASAAEPPPSKSAIESSERQPSHSRLNVMVCWHGPWRPARSIPRIQRPSPRRNDQRPVFAEAPSTGVVAYRV